MAKMSYRFQMLLDTGNGGAFSEDGANACIAAAEEFLKAGTRLVELGLI